MMESAETAALDAVNDELRKMEGELVKVQNGIETATAMLMEKGGPSAAGAEAEYWRKKEEQLRKEKEQLRKKEEQLRKEKEQLREKDLLLLQKSGGGKSVN